MLVQYNVHVYITLMKKTERKVALNLGFPEQFFFKGDKMMKNTWLNCWSNSYCLYHSWERPWREAVKSVLLIGWLNRDLLDSDRLD